MSGTDTVITIPSEYEWTTFICSSNILCPKCSCSLKQCVVIFDEQRAMIHVDCDKAKTTTRLEVFVKECDIFYRKNLAELDMMAAALSKIQYTDEIYSCLRKVCGIRTTNETDFQNLVLGTYGFGNWDSLYEHICFVIYCVDCYLGKTCSKTHPIVAAKYNQIYYGGTMIGKDSTHALILWTFDKDPKKFSLILLEDIRNINLFGDNCHKSIKRALNVTNNKKLKKFRLK